MVLVGNLGSSAVSKGASTKDDIIYPSFERPKVARCYRILVTAVVSYYSPAVGVNFQVLSGGIEVVVKGEL